MSNAEKIHNLERRSAEQKQKYEMAEITEVMKRAPACIPHLLQKLSSIGMRLDDLPQDTSEKAIPKSLQKAAADRRRSSNASSPRAADHDSTDMAGHSESSEPVTPTKYHRIESCSVSFLAEHCCEVWEPGNLSVPNVKRMLTRGRADSNKCLLQKFVECGSGLPPDTPINGKNNALKEFRAYCQSRYVARGRRLATVPLPPDWERHGVYELIPHPQDAQLARVRHRFTKEVHDVPQHMLPPGEWSDLYMGFNWSEVRAAICSRLDSMNERAFTVGGFFPMQVLPSSSAQEALTDSVHATANALMGPPRLLPIMPPSAEVPSPASGLPDSSHHSPNPKVATHALKKMKLDHAGLPDTHTETDIVPVAAKIEPIDIAVHGDSLNGDILSDDEDGSTAGINDTMVSAVEDGFVDESQQVPPPPE